MSIVKRLLAGTAIALCSGTVLMGGSQNFAQAQMLAYYDGYQGGVPTDGSVSVDLSILGTLGAPSDMISFTRPIPFTPVNVQPRPEERPVASADGAPSSGLMKEAAPLLATQKTIKTARVRAMANAESALAHGVNAPVSSTLFSPESATPLGPKIAKLSVDPAANTGWSPSLSQSNSKLNRLVNAVPGAVRQSSSYGRTEPASKVATDVARAEVVPVAEIPEEGEGNTETVEVASLSQTPEVTATVPAPAPAQSAPVESVEPVSVVPSAGVKPVRSKPAPKADGPILELDQSRVQFKSTIMNDPLSERVEEDRVALETPKTRQLGAQISNVYESEIIGQDAESSALSGSDLPRQDANLQVALASQSAPLSDGRNLSGATALMSSLMPNFAPEDSSRPALPTPQSPVAMKPKAAPALPPSSGIRTEEVASRVNTTGPVPLVPEAAPQPAPQPVESPQAPVATKPETTFAPVPEQPTSDLVLPSTEDPAAPSQVVAPAAVEAQQPLAEDRIAALEAALQSDSSNVLSDALQALRQSKNTITQLDLQNSLGSTGGGASQAEAGFTPISQGEEQVSPPVGSSSSALVVPPLEARSRPEGEVSSVLTQMRSGSLLRQPTLPTTINMDDGRRDEAVVAGLMNQKSSLSGMDNPQLGAMSGLMGARSELQSGVLPPPQEQPGDVRQAVLAPSTAEPLSSVTRDRTRSEVFFESEIESDPSETAVLAPAGGEPRTPPAREEGNGSAQSSVLFAPTFTEDGPPVESQAAPSTNEDVNLSRLVPSFLLEEETGQGEQPAQPDSVAAATPQNGVASRQPSTADIPTSSLVIPPIESNENRSSSQMQEAAPSASAPALSTAPVEDTAAPTDGARPSSTLFSVPSASPSPAVESAPEAPPQQVASLPRDVVVVSGNETTVHFGQEESELPKEAEAALNRLVQLLKEDPTLRVQIVGYADDTDRTANQMRRLSLFRTLAVRSYFVDRGVLRTQLDVRALGNTGGRGFPDRVDIILSSE